PRLGMTPFEPLNSSQKRPSILEITSALPIALISMGGMKSIVCLIALTVIVAALSSAFAQPSPEPKSDVSTKALVAKAPADILVLRRMADDYYSWRNENYPVASSDAGLHTWDSRLTDY